LNLKLTYRNNKVEYENQLQVRGNKLLSYESFPNYESFYAEVYQQMFQNLFGYGMRICGNRELVKDSIQELFSELWKNQKILTKIKSIEPYLLKCLKRRIKRESRKRKRFFIEDSFGIEISQEVKLIRDQQYLREQYLLKKALKLLTDRQREAIYLKFYSHLSYEEVAQVLSIKTKAVYKLVTRALSSLKIVMTTSS